MSPRSERTQRFLVVAAAGVPAALYLLYVWHYSFNLPFGDDWTKAPLIVDALRGHLDLGAMWDQHTEARLLIPNLVFVGVGRVDDFNIKVMVLLGALSFAASFFLILRLARDYVARPLTWLPVLVLGVVWFSLVDTGNSVWAFQFAWYLVIFFLALMLSFLLAWPFRRAVGVGLAALAAVCGSLSMVQGFALWPVGALCLWWTWKRTRADAVALLTWLGVMLVTAGAYFFHYEMGRGCTTGAHCSLTTPLHHPVHSGKFFVALVGYVVPKVGPFGREYAGLHQVIGLALCIAAGVVVVYSLRERKWVTRPPLALSLVVFAVLFDAALTVTRGGGRVVAASQSRFTMPNVVLVAAIVLFAWAHVPKHLAAGTGWRRRVRIGALAGLGVFVLAMAIFTTSSGLEEGRSWHRIQVTEARALANRGRIPRRTFPCYARIFVTNGSRWVGRELAAGVPVDRGGAEARALCLPARPARQVPCARTAEGAQRVPAPVGDAAGPAAEEVVSVPIDVQMIPTEELAADRRAAVIDLCIAAHDMPDFRRLFAHYIPSGGRHFLAYDGAVLVSHAVVTTRGVQPDGLPVLRTAYIDAVSTLPAYQGQGYGTAVMRRLAAEIPDYEIGCLQTDKPGFYDRMDWELWRGPLAGRGDDGVVPTPDQRGVMVLRLPRTPPLDLDALLTIEVQPDRIWE